MSNLAYPSVLCLGEVLWDCFVDQYPHPTRKQSQAGGAPANVAVKLAQLGTSTGFIGCVSQDRLGRELVDLLAHFEVNCQGIQYHSTAPTRSIYVVQNNSGDRDFIGFGDTLHDHFADVNLQASKIPLELFIYAEYLVIGTLLLSTEEGRSTLTKVLQLANLYNLKIILDVNWRPIFFTDQHLAKQLIKSIIPSIDFLKLSKNEALWLFDTVDAGPIFYQLNSLEGVIITKGENPVSYCINAQEGQVTPPTVKVIDPTGAGDSFLAGFIHQLVTQGMSSLKSPETIKQIIEYSCTIGSQTCTHQGAISI